VYIRGAIMAPPPASRVEPLMREWIAWIDGEGREYEPVMRAAIAHHGFEAVHPSSMEMGALDASCLTSC